MTDSGVRPCLLQRTVAGTTSSPTGNQQRCSCSSRSGARAGDGGVGTGDHRQRRPGSPRVSPARPVDHGVRQGSARRSPCGSCADLLLAAMAGAGLVAQASSSADGPSDWRSGRLVIAEVQRRGLGGFQDREINSIILALNNVLPCPALHVSPPAVPPLLLLNSSLC